MTHDNPSLAFHGYVLTTRPFSLSRRGQPVDVPRQCLELLDYLIAHRDRVATRAELIERFWSLSQVGADQSLNTCVRRLRRALEESRGAASLIETHPRVGYRFVGEMEPIIAARAIPAWRRAVFASFAAVLLLGAVSVAQGSKLTRVSRGADEGAPAGAPAVTTAIAVPPGRNMCEKALFPMFLEGLQETLIVEIYRSAGEDISLLRVTSREAAESHEVAQYYFDLGVRQMPDRTIANLSLVSTATGEIAWTTQFEEFTNFENYLSTQETIAAHLAEAFAARNE